MSKLKQAEADYSAKSIVVLEGLEPVRLRPGMYIGGTDTTALHHLFSEILDNSIDEVVEGHGSNIAVTFNADGSITVADDGRGIPTDNHPQFPDKSAAEIIMTKLHSGGKFSGKNYKHSGGLHGVGISVVNALSDRLTLEISRSHKLWRQSYVRGVPQGPLAKVGPIDKTGTSVTFHPDPEIFGDLSFDPTRIYKMCCAKAYLVPRVNITWSCEADVEEGTPRSDLISFPGGIADALARDVGTRPDEITPIWAGKVDLPEEGRLEWAIAWLRSGQTGIASYCNTITTPLGGTHETGFRSAIMKSMRQWGESTKNSKTKILSLQDLDDIIRCKISIFIRDPQFQGQTKDKLTNPGVAKLIEIAMRDQIDHFLAQDARRANDILAAMIEKAEARAATKSDDVNRKSPTKRLRLPGKLTDCTSTNREDTEIFIVEGDSAGGSAKQARSREFQAILPLRGKILNVASSSEDKMNKNQEIKDLIEALGCGSGRHFDINSLRYGRVIIMTDADVDGSHISTLLMSLFLREMSGIIRTGRLYLAQPPLYRVSNKDKSVYLRDDAALDGFMAALKRKMPNAKVSIGRFKGLGEMPPAVLKETTMDPTKRTLLRVGVPNGEEKDAGELVERLMGRNAEMRFRLIQENASKVAGLDL